MAHPGADAAAHLTQLAPHAANGHASKQPYSGSGGSEDSEGRENNADLDLAGKRWPSRDQGQAEADSDYDELEPLQHEQDEDDDDGSEYDSDLSLDSRCWPLALAVCSLPSSLHCFLSEQVLQGH